MRFYKFLLVSTLLWPLTGHAEPKPLSDNELDGVSAGLFDVYVVMPVVVVHNNNETVATGVHSQNISADSVSNVDVDTVINFQPSATNQIGNMGPVVLGAPLVNSVNGPAQIGMGFGNGGARMPTPPVWVPWAAELRSALGVQ